MIRRLLLACVVATSCNVAGAAAPYSPNAGHEIPTFPLWGDSHLHTAYSTDAGLFGGRLGLDDAYRFARGEEVVSATGQPAKLRRPLDWLVISDHSDGMGLIFDLRAGTPNVLALEEGRRWHAGIKTGGEAAVEATKDLITTFAQGRFPPQLIAEYGPGAEKYANVWADMVKAAETYNEPGRFTALMGFEWTSLSKGNNLHRNVVFRDDGEKVGGIVPYTTQGPAGSVDPLDLYRWLSNYETTTGGKVLAIAHNGNLSNGWMFPTQTQFTGKAIDTTYVEQRARWEPLYEVTQIKGDGEAHPLLSPDDAFADYETWDAGNLDLSEAKTPDMLEREYARAALKNGLVLESRLGTNPYKFGMIGSTDSHTSLSTAEEDNFFGKHAGTEPSGDRMLKPFTQTPQGVFEGYETVASGMAAVWATANTRAAIWDAMARKEVYATTGPRITVRFFGGWHYDRPDVSSPHLAEIGYSKGVPMGGDLPARGASRAPTFMIAALRDPLGANLDRIQIIKGWVDTKGAAQEKVYDVVWSGARKPDRNGVLPAVGNTVDVATATWQNTIGAGELASVWTDPDFDPNQSAFYYARVMEIPTPRWIVYDAVRFGVSIPQQAQTTGQERAYTSPIWYAP